MNTMASPIRWVTADFRLSYSNTRGTPPNEANAASWWARKLPIRMSTPKRRNIQRDHDSTITKATKGRRVPSIST